MSNQQHNPVSIRAAFDAIEAQDKEMEAPFTILCKEAAKRKIEEHTGVRDSILHFQRDYTPTNYTWWQKLKVWWYGRNVSMKEFEDRIKQ